MDSQLGVLFVLVISDIEAFAQEILAVGFTSKRIQNTLCTDLLVLLIASVLKKKIDVQFMEKGSLLIWWRF